MTVAVLGSTLIGCSDDAAPVTPGPTSSALAITSARQLADVVGCAGYQPSPPTGFTEGGDCTVGGVDFHLYVFASNSDRNALVNAIFRTTNDVKYAVGDTYTIASLDEATIKAAADKLGPRSSNPSRPVP